MTALLLGCCRDGEMSETTVELLTAGWSLLGVWHPPALSFGGEQSLAVGNMVWRSQLGLSQAQTPSLPFTIKIGL